MKIIGCLIALIILSACRNDVDSRINGAAEILDFYARLPNGEQVKLLVSEIMGEYASSYAAEPYSHDGYPVDSLQLSGTRSDGASRLLILEFEARLKGVGWSFGEPFVTFNDPLKFFFIISPIEAEKDAEQGGVPNP